MIRKDSGDALGSGTERLRRVDALSTKQDQSLLNPYQSFDNSQRLAVLADTYHSVILLSISSSHKDCGSSTTRSVVVVALN